MHDHFLVAKELGATQIEEEIFRFLEIAREIRPRRICEIGTSKGGTTFLFARAFEPDAEIVGIDLYVQNRIQVRHFLKPGQRVRFIDGDSRDTRTVQKVERALGGAKLDLLFIDGDHSYAGVSNDFLSYRHLVRDGGLIAFHDIQPDGRAQGIQTEAYGGEVPEFWQRVRPLYSSEEFIGSPSQFGCGIGVLLYRSDVALPTDLARQV